MLKEFIDKNGYKHKVVYSTYSIHDIEGDGTELCNLLNELDDKYGLYEISIEDSFYDEAIIKVYYYKKETDKEREKRLIKLKKDREREKEREKRKMEILRKEYERLKKIFENDGD